MTHLVIINFRTLVVDFSLRFGFFSSLLLFFVDVVALTEVVVGRVKLVVVVFFSFFFNTLLFSVSLLLFCIHFAHTHTHTLTTHTEQRTLTLTHTYRHALLAACLRFLLLFHSIRARSAGAFASVFQPPAAASGVASVFTNNWGYFPGQNACFLARFTTISPRSAKRSHHFVKLCKVR